MMYDTLMYPKYISSNILLKVLLRKMRPKSGLKNQISLEYIGYYYLAKIAKLCIDKNYWNDLDNKDKTTHSHGVLQYCVIVIFSPQAFP